MGDEDTLNFGTILTRDGVLEMHYIAVEVGISAIVLPDNGSALYLK